MRIDASADRAVRLWTHDLTDYHSPPAAWLEALSDEEHSQCLRFRREQDRLSYAASHALLYRAISQTLGLAPVSLRIGRDSMGKPFLVEPECTGINFSISHTDGMVAVATSLSGKVGVDVEAVDRYGMPQDDLCTFGLSVEEIAELAAFSEQERRARFIALWTAREAVAKADGRGLSLPFAGILINLSRNEATISQEVSCYDRHWHLWCEWPSPHHILALAWLQDDCEILRMGSLLV